MKQTGEQKKQVMINEIKYIESTLDCAASALNDGFYEEAADSLCFASTSAGDCESGVYELMSEKENTAAFKIDSFGERLRTAIDRKDQVIQAALYGISTMAKEYSADTIGDVAESCAKYFFTLNVYPKGILASGVHEIISELEEADKEKDGEDEA